MGKACEGDFNRAPVSVRGYDYSEKFDKFLGKMTHFGPYSIVWEKSHELPIQATPPGVRARPQRGSA